MVLLAMLLPAPASASPPAGDPARGAAASGGWYRPKVDVTWQWQLTGAINTGYPVELYDVDLFDTPRGLIERLHAAGRKVICYFSAGSYEDWREDRSAFDPAVLGNPLDDWPGERWLDIRTANVRAVMTKRLDLARRKGCDGVEPDNVDGYLNPSGFNLSAADQLDFNRMLAKEAHRRGLAVALKNDLEQVEELVGYFDLALTEQCDELGECALLAPFIESGKPVLHVEYAEVLVTDGAARRRLCARSAGMGLRTLVLPRALDDSFRFACAE